MITTDKQRWKATVCDSRSGKILRVVYVGGDDADSARAAAKTQARLMGVKRRVKIYVRMWSIVEDARAMASGFVRRISDDSK
jgi:hypothetical protein